MAKVLDPLCPAIQSALEVLGRPWTGLVLAVLQDGALRYSELAGRMPGIGDKVLCARLKELEERDLVVRLVEPGPPVRVAYRLTPKGAGFKKVVTAIDAWGRDFQAKPTKARKSRE